MLVEGLEVNLINISQVYDQNFFVKFTRDKFDVLNLGNSCIMEGNKSLNKCYLLVRRNTRLNTLMNNTDLWH